MLALAVWRIPCPVWAESAGPQRPPGRRAVRCCGRSVPGRSGALRHQEGSEEPWARAGEPTAGIAQGPPRCCIAHLRICPYRPRLTARPGVSIALWSAGSLASACAPGSSRGCSPRPNWRLGSSREGRGGFSPPLLRGWPRAATPRRLAASPASVRFDRFGTLCMFVSLALWRACRCQPRSVTVVLAGVWHTGRAHGLHDRERGGHFGQAVASFSDGGRSPNCSTRNTWPSCVVGGAVASHLKK